MILRETLHALARKTARKQVAQNASGTPPPDGRILHAKFNMSELVCDAMARALKRRVSCVYINGHKRLSSL